MRLEDARPGVWYHWPDFPPPYDARSIECRRGKNEPFPLDPSQVAPWWNVMDVFWRDPL